MPKEGVIKTRVTLPVPKRPRGRPPKHGAFCGAELAPVADLKEQEIREILEGQKVALSRADSIPVTMLARTLAKMELLDRFFISEGLFDAEQKIRQGDLKIYLAAMNSAARLCDMLGLTPQSRLRLGIGMIQAKKDLAQMMADTPQDGSEGEPE